jgi:uncharacterized protein YggU (UPF0235/DUF167 family)
VTCLVRRSAEGAVVIVEIEHGLCGGRAFDVREDALLLRVAWDDDGNQQAVHALTTLLGLDAAQTEVVAGMCVKRKRLLIRGADPYALEAQIVALQAVRDGG